MSSPEQESMTMIVILSHGFTSERHLSVDRAELRSSPDGWIASRWLFRSHDGNLEMGCGDVDEVACMDDERLPIVASSSEFTFGPVEVAGVVSGIPAGAHCLLHAPRFDGAWQGWAVTMAFGRMIVSEHDYDPS
jgi:hypothetical protein